MILGSVLVVGSARSRPPALSLVGRAAVLYRGGLGWHMRRKVR